METRKTRLALTAGSLALALALAGCGGGGNSSGPTATGGSGGGGAPPPATEPDPPAQPTNLVADLEHGITAALVARAHAIQLFDPGPIMIMAGMSQKVGGVRFSCPEGGSACTITVNAGATADLTTVTYDEDGGMPMVAALVDKGNTAFENLAKVLVQDGTDGKAKLTDLMSNIYHDDDDVDAAPDATPPVEAKDNGGGVTSSLTTHEQPGTIGDADPLTGISDLFVTVAATGVPEEYASKKLRAIAQTGDERDANENATPPVTAVAVGDVFEKEISRVVMVDENGDLTNGHTAKFVATADWYYNPAQNWEATREEGMPDMGFWTYVINAMEPGQDLDGGRTLYLAMRSDFDPNNMEKGGELILARGTGDDGSDQGDETDQSEADWDMIVLFDSTSIADALDSDGNVEFGREVAFPEDGVKGSYMGVKGMFTCHDADQNNECLVNHHTSDKLGVSGEDELHFTPYVYAADDDWITAGAWMTIPDDQEQGDYAIGAFAYGIDPYKPDEASTARGLRGTASYEGQAFGRYAEVDGAHTEVGRFTATAMLTADFDTADSVPDNAGNNFGAISGNLTDFMANGQEEGWDVNFESAVLAMGMTDDDTPAIAPNSALRFNAGASGHARGHALTGYWNGQFYNSGDNAVMVPSPDDPALMVPQPGSAAGTFGLTTERDDMDSYSLTLGGAFVTHHEEREAASAD